MGLQIKLQVFPELESTNTYLHSLGPGTLEGTTIQALHQSGGKGQRNSKWVDEPNNNLLISTLLKPKAFPVNRVFAVSQMAALSVWHTVADFLGAEGTCIKWPNDVLVRGDKIAGILIETQLVGSQLASAIVGVGLNVNQTNWTAAFARPATSLRKEKGADFELDAVRTQWLRNLAYYYTRLQAGQLDWLHSRYQSVLYRLGLPTAFADQSGSPFTATALGTTTEGFLRVKTNGVERHFPFKEIQFLQ